MPPANWYEEAFGDHYLQVYARRQATAARQETSIAREKLDLKPGERVLDFCCGPGYHLTELTRAGLHAAGFDLSPELIAMAGKRGFAARGDMRSVPFAGGFDAVLSFFTTIGYFADQENEIVFREINRLLRPNGRFLIDYLNPSTVQATLVPTSERQVGEVKIKETRWIDNHRVCKKVELLFPDQEKNKTYTESVRLYDLDQLTAMMGRAGLTITNRLGDFTGTAFTIASPRMILIGKKDNAIDLQPWQGETTMFKQLPAGHDRNFAYLLADHGQAALIDPAQPDTAIKALAEAGLELKYIINTHGHYDHTGGNQAVKAQFPDALIAAHATTGVPRDIALEGDEELTLGETTIKVLATPGHTADSICLLWQGRLVTGDTLFVGKVGGTATIDEAERQYHSLHQVIGVLPAETEIWPGHDVGIAPCSTVCQEKETNPFYQQADFTAFVDLKNNWADYKRTHGIE